MGEVAELTTARVAKNRTIKNATIHIVLFLNCVFFIYLSKNQPKNKKNW